MGKILIKKHKFEDAKEKIKIFSKNLPSNPCFDRVEIDGGLFGLGDHKVTGSEMNTFIGKVQDKFTSVNFSLRNIISEFKEVYNAFDFLDGEYISGIIGSIESAKEASQQASKAQANIKVTVENLKKTVVGLVNLKATVERIEKTINTQKQNVLSYDEITKKLDDNYKIRQIPSFMKTVSTLQTCYTFLLNKQSLIDTDVDKSKNLLSLIKNQEEKSNVLNTIFSQLSSNLHYKDIDTIWNDVEEHKANLAGFHQQVDGFIEKVNQTTERINDDIVTLQQYRFVLESHEHLGDIDTIWSDVEEHKANLAGFHQQVDGFIEKVNQTTERINDDIVTLQQYRSVLESHEHLGDIDTIWSNVEEQKANLAGFHQQVDNFISEIHTSEVGIKESIQRMIESNNAAHQLYDKKIKTAYYIGGTAVFLSILHLIIQAFGVI